ncbi:hypothetical protein [Streptomyces sp. Agncl-13]|uniref:hypothetical protein n=1 Tax=Streptomyces sp. Agncl-13 TaxID=3400628 RepID=UPI003A85C868
MAVYDTLGNAEDVIDIGAGTGSYESPPTVLAVEPSRIMLAQRPPCGRWLNVFPSAARPPTPSWHC